MDCGPGDGQLVQVDPDDVEMLEDLLVAAVNEALDKVDAESAGAMSRFTGGMPGGLL